LYTVGLHKLIKTLQSTQNETEALIEMLLYGHFILSHNIRLKEVQQRLLDDPGYDLLEYLRGIAQNCNYLLYYIIYTNTYKLY